MSTHNICLCGKMRKISMFLGKKKSTLSGDMVTIQHPKEKSICCLSDFRAPVMRVIHINIFFFIFYFPCCSPKELAQIETLLTESCVSLLQNSGYTNFHYTCHKLWTKICGIRQHFKGDLTKFCEIFLNITLELPEYNLKYFFFSCKKACENHNSV